MKKTSLIRTVCACLVVSLFAGMAMASGSSSSTKETGSVTISDDGTKATETEEEVTTTTTVQEKAEFEITHTTFTHSTNSLGSETYCGIVEIKNTGNCCIYLEDCTFDFEDDNGHLLDTDKLISCSPNVIAPGEYGYFFNDGLLDDTVSLDNGVNLVPNFSIEVCKKGEAAIVDYEVSDLDLRDNDYGMGLKVTGRVENNTSEDTSSIDVMIIAVFLDSDGEILDIGFTYADEMSAGGKTSFELSTTFGNREISTDDVAEYKVIARKTYLQF